MNDDLLKISLNQGRKFNTYQTKIKKTAIKVPTSNRVKREGFVSATQEVMLQPDSQGYIPALQNKQMNTKATNNINQNELNDLIQLQSQYEDLLQQYNSIQKSVGDASLETINRTSTKQNPYLNKHIRFNDGAICYVTSQGVARVYTSWDQYINTAGRNGCPAIDNPININMPFLSTYVEGTKIPTTPSLIVGPPMVQGISCGQEGKNVYASKLINNVNASYVGCYNDVPASTPINLVPPYPTEGSADSAWEKSGIGVGWSTSYQDNFELYGGPNALKQNPATWWRSDVKYNSGTGIYEGQNGKSPVVTVNSGTQSVLGEQITIFFPNAATANAQKVVVTEYSLASGNDDNALARSPNSWYLVGSDDDQTFYELDRQINQSFSIGTSKSFTVANPGSYSIYTLIFDKVGNEGTNGRDSIQVSNINYFSNTNYSLPNDQRAMIWDPNMIGYTTYEKCQQYAGDNGYQYFGLQDYKADGTAECLVSNDLAHTQMYGDGSLQVTDTPIWSSGTVNVGGYVRVSTEGYLGIYIGGGVYYQTNDATEQCYGGGKINDVHATWGANCNGQNNWVVNNDNALGSVWDATNVQSGQIVSANYTVGTGISDPAFGCPKAFDTSYKCGSTYKSGHIDGEAGGQNFIYDCTSEVNVCKFRLVLQTDGNMAIYQDNNSTAIWATNTTGQQRDPNPNRAAKKGKYGTSFLLQDQVLYPGEWIGSDDGSLYLTLQTDGNLVLYTSTIKEGCSKDANGKTVGNQWVNAVYKMDEVGDNSVLGKLGYVDSSDMLREYPSSMLAYSNQYQIYPGYDSPNNDISNAQVSSQTDCETACNGNAECAGYVFQSTTNTCWLKNKNVYPRGSKVPNSSLVLGIREPTIVGTSGCNKDVVDIDTVEYSRYQKGEPMAPDTSCNSSLVSSEDRMKLDNVQNQLQLVAQDIASKMESLYNQDNMVYNKLNMNSDQFKKNLAMYKNVNQKIQMERQIESKGNIEGMRNLKEGLLTIKDVNGMLTETDITVLQENYKYIFWSILAVGALTVTLNIMKK